MPLTREPLFHDRQFTCDPNSQTTTSASFVDITNATLTTKDLAQNANYMIGVSVIISASVANTLASFQLTVDGAPEDPMGRALFIKLNNTDLSDTFLGFVVDVDAGSVLKIRWKTDKGTLTLANFDFMIDGIPETRIVT